MFHIPKKQHLLMLVVSIALAVGGILFPSTAFAAPATERTGAVTTRSADQSKTDPDNKGKKTKHNKNKPKHKHNKNRHHKKGEAKDIKNMPGCVFHNGRVYCEHKQPKSPAPRPTSPIFKVPPKPAPQISKIPKLPPPGPATPTLPPIDICGISPIC